MTNQSKGAQTKDAIDLPNNSFERKRSVFHVTDVKASVTMQSGANHNLGAGTQHVRWATHNIP